MPALTGDPAGLPPSLLSVDRCPHPVVVPSSADIASALQVPFSGAGHNAGFRAPILGPGIPSKRSGTLVIPALSAGTPNARNSRRATKATQPAISANTRPRTRRRSVGPKTPSMTVFDTVMATTSLPPAVNQWSGSVFERIHNLRSPKKKGAFGENFFEQYCVRLGMNVDRPPRLPNGKPDVAADRIVNGHRVEVKLSTLADNGTFTFLQIRDDDYDYLFFLGIAPNVIQTWLIPKPVAMEHMAEGHGQHGGKNETLTRMLKVNGPDKALKPEWLNGWGGDDKRTSALLGIHLGNGPCVSPSL